MAVTYEIQWTCTLRDHGDDAIATIGLSDSKVPIMQIPVDKDLSEDNQMRQACRKFCQALQGALSKGVQFDESPQHAAELEHQFEYLTPQPV